MSFKDACTILENEFANHAEDISNIDLLGGEPLSNYEIIPQICNWVWKRIPDMPFFIRTNGTLLSTEMKKWFSIHAKQVGLGLSFDGTPETNLFNRGTKEVDIDFFKTHWPDIPIKVTVFPKSVSALYDSILYLHSKGVSLTGNLAQGVEWDENSCASLNVQLEKLVTFYLSHKDIRPIAPLFSLDFEYAFLNQATAPDNEKPCWLKTMVHTYDCDKDMLPCQMFSVIVQGKEKRSTILEDAQRIDKELIDKECKICPIRWSCTNCMALNYQIEGKFDKNINRRYSCTAHKITAYWSALLLASLASNNQVNLSEEEKLCAVKNAITYIKLFNHEK